ncbi:MAG: hypothetical protein HWE39_16605 [Oceanospirillaceae bacterium]|nr:hypothetical protein [Oceanospirillaceae bacterium]
MHTERRRLANDTASPPAVEAATGLDRGFGQMLQHAGIPQDLIEELAQENDERGDSLLEQALLDRWPVDDYAAAVAEPEAVLAQMQPAWREFTVAAQDLVCELEALDIAGLIEIRFPVGGVQLDWRRFERCDLFLGQLWLAEAQMYERLAASRDRLEAICRPARTWALASSARKIARTCGQTRAAAAESGDLHAYLNLLFGQAWNLEGINALEQHQLAAKGLSPLLLAGGAPRLRSASGALSHAFRALGFSARYATAAQLRAVARILFDTDRLEPEQFSLLCHGEWLLPAAEAALPQNWIDRFGELLSELWIRGDRGSRVESTLQLLKRAESGVAA